MPFRAPRSRTATLHGLFFLSGAAGLIYQVSWVRQFSLVFGSSVHSASVVTATFLAGLGLGGWLAGAWADRHRGDLLGAWARVELAIGALGLALIAILPRLQGVSAAISAYVPTDAGWQELSTGSLAARVGIAATVLMPSAMAMGATLTLLVRHQVLRASEAGFRVAGLYGANTAGAALGAGLTETVLVPALGLGATQGLAVVANLLVGGLALGLARTEPTVDVAVDEAPTATAVLPRVAAALFLAGFAAMGMELTWFRFLAGALGPYRAVFSLLLAILLASHAGGAAVGGALHRRHGNALHGFALAQLGFAATALFAMFAYDPYALLERQHAAVPAYEAAGWLGRAVQIHWLNGRTIAVLVAVPAAFMGVAFPLGNALGQRAADRVGRTVGALYLATTAGNVTGALVTGFALLPGPGIQATVWILAGAALLAPLPLLPWPRALALAGGLTGAGLLASTVPNRLVWSTFPYGRAQSEGVLELREGLEQILVVTGRPEGPARLWTSGHPMTSTSPHAQRYMRAMAHIPLLLQERPARVLVICVGAGNTLHAASLHPSVRSLEAVDLSADVLAVNHWFAHSNQHVLDDPRTRTFVNDGRHHLLLQPPGTYDLITLEPPPLAVAGVSSLYAREFYALAASRLTPTGTLAQWLPAYQVPDAAVRSLVRAFAEVFPDAVLLVGSGRELILLGGTAPTQLVPEAIERRLRERPEVAADLERIGLGDLQELATTFAADGETLLRATAQAPPVTDDRPILESAQGSHLMKTTLPAELFAPRRVDRWCPDCDLAALEPILRVTERLYASETFLHYSSIVPDRTSVLPAPDTENGTLAALVQSQTLGRVLIVPDALALRAQELWDAGERDAARAHLALAREQAPGVPLLDGLAAEWEAATP